MKINLDQKVYALSGKAFTDSEDKPLTLRTAIEEILTNAPAISEEDKVSQQLKLTRYELSLRVKFNKGDTIDITSEDISLIKRLGIYLRTDLYGYIVYLLEGKDTPIIPEDEKKHPPEKTEIRDRPAPKADPEISQG